MLEAVAQLIPELYAFCKNVYSSQSIIMFGTSEVLSVSGAQQGDPLGPLLFCITLQPILERLQSDLKIAFLDDVTVGGLGFGCSDRCRPYPSRGQKHRPGIE